MPLTPEPHRVWSRPLATAMLARFTRTMAGFAGFEAMPRLVVAVSGGVDSMALCRLAREWCARRGGDILAVTVDHGLRPDSAAEAHQVGEWLARLEISHQILTWEGDKPKSGVQAAAREARYRCLETACRNWGALHVLLAHHAGDQRETAAMRASRDMTGGGPGIAALDYRRCCRVLRPLLAMEKSELLAFCQEIEQTWVEDPSNRSDVYERNRMRKRLARTGDAGLSQLDAAISRAQAERAALQPRVAAAVQAWVRVSPLGWLWVNRAAWQQAVPDPLRDLALLGRLVQCVGGGIYPPARASLVRVLDEILSSGGRSISIGGCVVRPLDNGVWVLRERRGRQDPAWQEKLWDGRFVAALRMEQDLRYSRNVAERAEARSLATAPDRAELAPPAAAASGFPLADDGDRLCLPSLVGYDPAELKLRFMPPRCLTACAVWLAPPSVRLM